MKKFSLFCVAALFCSNILAEERSVLTNAPTNAPEIATESASTSAVTVEPVVVCQNGSCKDVRYRGKRHIAPNAVPTGVEVARCEVCRDACCNPVCVKTAQGVEICAPACACKEDVRTSLNGKRKVYDYGKYEVVVTDRDDFVDVRYRRRILSR